VFAYALTKRRNSLTHPRRLNALNHRSA